MKPRAVWFWLLLLHPMGASAAQATEGRGPGAPSGHPKIELDLLDLSAAPLSAADEKYLRSELARDARSADWGAGRGAKIEYRFRLDELTVTEESKVVRVACSATGFLPRGKRAKGHLVLSGAPQDRPGLVHHVLDIVAKSVVTRLADMERQRRLR
jgi:hypothetical protein